MNFLRTNLAHFLATTDVTQADLARAAGITQPNISRFLAPNGGDLKTGSAAGIAKLLGVSIDDLVWHDFRAGAPTAKSSQPDLDPEALASALVALDKAMTALKIPYRQVQRMAPTLRYAYKHLARNPDMPNSERALFDDALIGKLREDLHATTPGPGPRPATGRQSRSARPKG